MDRRHAPDDGEDCSPPEARVGTKHRRHSLCSPSRCTYQLRACAYERETESERVERAECCAAAGGALRRNLASTAFDPKESRVRSESVSISTTLLETPNCLCHASVGGGSWVSVTEGGGKGVPGTEQRRAPRMRSTGCETRCALHSAITPHNHPAESSIQIQPRVRD